MKSRNYESRSNDKSRYYNRLFDDTAMEDSIEKFHYNDKSHCYDGFSPDRCLLKLQDLTVYSLMGICLEKTKNLLVK